MLTLSRGIVRRSHTVEIVVLDPPEADWLRSMELQVHALGRGTGFYGYSPTLDRWLKARGDDYDRVIVNGLWQYPGLAVWRKFAGIVAASQKRQGKGAGSSLESGGRA